MIEEKKKTRVVMFSGGKDSTAMLIRMYEEGREFDEIMMADLGVEFPEMYEHVAKVERYVGRKITVVKTDFEYWFKDHVKTRGPHKGEKGYGWPDMGARWCTALKRSSIKKYLRGKDLIEFHGVAADEENRFGKNDTDGREIHYPLVEWGMTEANCLKFAMTVVSIGGVFIRNLGVYHVFYVH